MIQYTIYMDIPRVITEEERVNFDLNVRSYINDHFDSLCKEKRRVFKNPNLLEVADYFSERLNGNPSFKVEAAKFYDYYNSNGWRVGKNKMVDWKAAVRNWIRNLKSFSPAATPGRMTY